MAVKRRRLSDANVARLTPAAREYTVWDTRHAGLGVRVRASGHRSFIYCPKSEAGTRRITLGSAALTSVEEARTKCLAIETGARPDPTEHGAVPTFREFVWGPGRVCIDRCVVKRRRLPPPDIQENQYVAAPIGVQFARLTTHWRATRSTTRHSDAEYCLFSRHDFARTRETRVAVPSSHRPSISGLLAPRSQKEDTGT